MTDIVLHDIDPVLADRIRWISDARGWPLPDTLLRLLEHGLHVCESDAAVRLNDTEAGALEAAVAALEQVPDDAGFAMIGRAMPAATASPDEPDQHIAADFELK